MCSFSNFCFKPSEPLLVLKQLVLTTCPAILQNYCSDQPGTGLLAKFCSRRLSIDCHCFCHRFSTFSLNKFFFFFPLRLWLISRVLKWLWQFCQALLLLFLEKGFGKLLSLCWSHLVSIVCREWLYKKSYIVDLNFSSTENRTLAFHSTFLTHWSLEKEGSPYRLLKTELRYPILMHYLSLPLLCKFYSLHQGFLVWILEYDSHWGLPLFKHK